MESITIASVVNIMNVAMLLALLNIYMHNYRTVRSKFTSGLVLFAAFFLLHNLIALFFQLAMTPYYSKEVGGYALLINLLELLGFATLLYISRR